MRIYKTVLLIFFIAIVIYSQSSSDVRLIYYGIRNSQNIEDGFLARAKASGFNYVRVEYDQGKYYSNPAQWPNGNNLLQNAIRDDFIKVNQYNMRLIPCFSVGTMWSYGADSSERWRAVNGSNNHWMDTVPRQIHHHPNLHGFISYSCQTFRIFYFQPLLQIIRNAFVAAQPNLNYSTLEYLDFGHDEALDYYDGAPGFDRELLVGKSQLDRDWISQHNSDVVGLFLNELEERVNDVKSIDIFNPTKIIIFGDMWDINYHGVYNGPINSWNLSSLHSRASTNIKNNVIFMPWQYGTQIPDYNTYSTFNHFASNGCKIIMVHAFGDDGQSILPNMPQHWEEIIAADKAEYRKNIIGFGGMVWDGNGWSQEYHPPEKDQCWKIIEFFSQSLYYKTYLLD